MFELLPRLLTFALVKLNNAQLADGWPAGPLTYYSLTHSLTHSLTSVPVTLIFTTQ
jgi:hypothetical protein